ncbi:MAG: tetratricopeptide repeat protein [Candidatus Omnitrophica bacterium]|nr:tetratricopeptide repeat protein [Candidatus Omnitrophota bacterium]
MKRNYLLFLVIILITGIFLSSCSPKKASSSNEAIDISKDIATAQEKADYLMGQAKAFYNSKQFQEAVDITQYVLRFVDTESQEAKDLLEKAKKELEAAAKGAVNDVKKSIGF